MNKKQSHSVRASMLLKNFISLFLFLCVILLTTIIGSIKGKINLYIASIIALLSLFGILILVLEAKKNNSQNKKQLVNKFVKEEDTANNKRYRFLQEKDGYVVFDSNGYIIEAKGFGSLMWYPANRNIDKDLIGKHVDELAKMLKEYAASREVYSNFEIQVHIELLKEMLKN